MIQQTTNILASAIAEEMNDLINSFSGKETEDSKGLSRINKEGQVLIPISENPEHLDYKDYKDYFEFNENEGYPKTTEYGEIYSNVEMNTILKIDGNKEVLQNILLDLFENKDSSIYGILIVQGDQRYNILHPIIANYIITEEIELEETFKIVLYTYKPNCNLSNPTTNDEFIERIVDIVNTINNKGYKAKGITQYNKNININLASKEVSFMNTNFSFNNGKDARPEYCIAPVQLMSDSIAIPYYGAIACRTTGGAYNGIHLTPMACGNVSLTKGYDWHEICTGNYSNRKYNSLYVMNDMNIDSLMNSYVLADDWKEWIFDCQMFSIFLMYEKEILEREKVSATIEVKKNPEELPLNNILKLPKTDIPALQELNTMLNAFNLNIEGK